MFKMKVERIFSGEISVEKLLKELLVTQIDNLIKAASTNDDNLSQNPKGSEE